MRVAFLLLVIAVAGCLDVDAPAAERPDLISATIYTGKFWTGTEPMFVHAVAVAENTIVATGSLAQVQQVAAGDIFELDGLVVPGFHDTHNHLLDWVTGSLQGDLFSDDPSAMAPTTFDPVQGTANQQVIGSLHVCHWGVQHAESNAENQGTTWPMVLPDTFGPNLARDSCYLGAGSETPRHALLLAKLQEAEAIAASMGVTSHAQAGMDPEVAERFLELSPRLRWSIYLWPEGIEAGFTTGDGDEHVRIAGVKVYSDGWLGPRTAAMHANYGDRPHNGFQFYEQDDLNAIVQAARAQGLKVTAHAIGDRAVDAMLSAYASVDETVCTVGPTCGDPRYSIEHASVIQPTAFDKLVALNVVPSVQLSFPTSDAHWMESAMGEGAGAPYPWQTLLDLGVRLGGSSDWPIEALSPLWGIERAVTRQEVDDSLPAPYQPGQAIDIDAALRMLTVDAAYLLFMDDMVGSLEPGKRADMVWLGSDLFEIPAGDIADVSIKGTMVDGDWFYQGPAA